jgi:hypothetical protein
MSYTRLNYPAAFASEGNPLHGGGFPGDFDPYVHGVNDTMDIDDETGYFSLDVSLTHIFEAVAKVSSTCQDSRSSQLPLLWSKEVGITPGGKQLYRRFFLYVYFSIL